MVQFQAKNPRCLTRYPVAFWPGMRLTKRATSVTELGQDDIFIAIRMALCTNPKP
jgi:hypothetical protein